MPSILNLPSLSTSTGNIVFPVVDVNVTPNTTKKATLSQIKDYIGATVIAPQGYTGSVGSGYAGSVGYVGSASTAPGYAGSLGYTGSIGYVGSASTAPGYTGSVGYVGSKSAPVYIAGTTSTSLGLPLLWEGDYGDLYITTDNYHSWVWTINLQWEDVGPITGYTGSIGYTGSQGIVGYVGSASTLPGYTGSTGYFSGSTAAAIITTNTSISTSTTTGALQVSGGVGIGGNVNAGGTVKSDALFVLPSYTLTTVEFIVAPPEGSIVYVSDAPGGGQPCFYDGVSWYTIDGRVQIA